MKCPNEKCGNRALSILATGEVSIEFTDKGGIERESYGEWYINDESEAYCKSCHWAGFYRDCQEADDLRSNTA